MQNFVDIAQPIHKQYKDEIEEQETEGLDEKLESKYLSQVPI